MLRKTYITYNIMTFRRLISQFNCMANTVSTYASDLKF
jgi:hypothetical protein